MIIVVSLCICGVFCTDLWKTGENVVEYHLQVGSLNRMSFFLVVLRVEQELVFMAVFKMSVKRN